MRPLALGAVLGRDSHKERLKITKHLGKVAGICLKIASAKLC